MVPKSYLPLFTFTLHVLFVTLLFSSPSKVTANEVALGSEDSSPVGFLEQLKDSHKGDKVKGINDLKKYLHKYGYLDRKHHIYFDDDFDEHLEEAVRVYQINFNLNPTGILDEETISTMMKPRCGVADFINGTTSMRAATMKHNYSEIPIRVRYELPDGNHKWPPNKYTLTFGFLPSARPECKTPVTNAFRVWQWSTHFKFPPSQDAQTADLKIAFHARAGVPGDNPFEGPGGALAHAFLPTGGQLHFDEEEKWSVGARPGSNDYFSIALHEIGHMLGLGHSSVRGSVMFPYITDPTGYKRLHLDDITGIKDLYNCWFYCR